MNKLETKLKIAFWGTSEFAVGVLEQLKDSPYQPNLIITAPDKPAGRKLKLTPPPVKIWADKNKIFTQQPEKLNEDFLSLLKKSSWELFIVTAYGKIIPQTILDLPQHGTLNVHPSLLPKLRGATPIHSALLGEDKDTGISILLLDNQMDHGPIIAQEKFPLYQNSISELLTKSQLEKQLSHLGGQMLNQILPAWFAQKIIPQEQNHSQATITQKLTSADGLINLADDAVVNFKKIQAFDTWPRAHFFHQGKRIIIKKAHLEQNKLFIDKIIPEGGEEINYSDLIK